MLLCTRSWGNGRTSKPRERSGNNRCCHRQRWSWRTDSSYHREAVEGVHERKREIVRVDSTHVLHSDPSNSPPVPSGIESTRSEGSSSDSDSNCTCSCGVSPCSWLTDTLPSQLRKVRNRAREGVLESVCADFSLGATPHGYFHPRTQAP